MRGFYGKIRTHAGSECPALLEFVCVTVHLNSDISRVFLINTGAVDLLSLEVLRGRNSPW